MIKFSAICRMPQASLKKYVTEQLCQTHNKVIVEDGFVFAQGTFPVLLVAHLDTVHQQAPSKILYNPITDQVSSPQGIGGDDRCGVYMILEIIKKHHCSVLFCEDEEVGGIGAHKFVESALAQDLTFNYIIELDRKGKNDAVFYDCDNAEFERFITKDYYKTAWGTFSDISIIAPHLGCAAVNLSCGYYNAHTTQEYVVMSEMHTGIKAVCKILARTTEEDVYEYIESDRGWLFSKGFSLIDEEEFYIEYLNEIGEYDLAIIYADSQSEAIDKFLLLHPEVSRNNAFILEW